MEKTKELVCVIDVQQKFIKDSNSTEIDNIRRFISRYDKARRVSVTFSNKSKSNFVEQLDWKKLINSKPNQPSFVTENVDKSYTRNTYDATNTLEMELTDSIQKFYILGCETDACILSTAFSVFDMGIRPIVLSDCIFTSAGESVRKGAMEILKRNIGEKNIINSKNI